MALTAAEEAQTRELLAQQAAILSLADSEAAIISNLGATDVSLSDLGAATVVDDADLLLIRQGVTDKSVSGLIIKSLASVPDASETVKGIVELATAAEAQAGIDTVRAVTPAGLSASAQSVAGSFSSLKSSATGTNATVTVTADEIVVESATNAYKTLRAVSLSIAGTSVGANGLDALPAIAVSTWYSVWAIWNGTTPAGLLSLSATSPTLPSGYTHKARVGWIRTDSTANKYPLIFSQYGSRVEFGYAAGANLTAWQTLASGSATTIVSIGLSAFIPPTAGVVRGAIMNTANNWSLVAKNTSVTGQTTIGAITYGSATQQQCFYEISVGAGQTIAWQNSGGGAVYISGYEDNL